MTRRYFYWIIANVWLATGVILSAFGEKGAAVQSLGAFVLSGSSFLMAWTLRDEVPR